MRAIYLVLLASAGCAVAVKKSSSSKVDADVVYISSESSPVQFQPIYTTVKIPHGQTAEISCVQKGTDTAASKSKPSGRSKQPAVPKAPVQTVQIVGAKYLIPPGAAQCESEWVLFAYPITACSGHNSTSCTFRANDPSEKNGCKERRLGIRYACGNMFDPAPEGAAQMMVNNMIDDN